MKETVKNLRSVYQFGKKYKKNFLFFTIATCFGVLFNVIVPILTAQQIVYLTNNQFYQLILSTLLIFTILFLNTIKIVVIQKNTSKYFRGVSKSIQNQLGSEMFKLKQKEIDNSSSGALIKRLTDDVSQMSHVFTIGEGYLTAILSKIGIFITIFIINKIIFLYYVCCSAILIWIDLNGLKKYTKKNMEYKESEDEVSSLTGELVRGIKDIKMLNSEKSFMQIFNQKIDGMSNKLYQVRDITIHYDAIINTLNDFFVIGLIFLLIFLIQNNQMETAIAVVLFTYRSEVLENIIDSISNLLTLVKNFNLSCSRVFEIIDNQKYAKEKFGSQHINKINGDFEFKDVSFGYSSDHLILNHLNLKVHANEKVGFVGKSGAGKTTIFNLLCKMYDNYEGDIFIDNYNIKNLDKDSIRGNITIVQQNPYIFNMSIRDNLKLVKKDLTEEEMIYALKLACLNDFILTLPKQYDTVVGEGGIMLSGGQKQRLAIARAFIQKTEIILFDEATSALDNETQTEIKKAIDNLSKDYTILIIAHRLSTVLDCDRILFLEDGKITCQGTHEDLLKNSEGYRRLYETELKKQ